MLSSKVELWTRCLTVYSSGMYDMFSESVITDEADIWQSIKLSSR